MRVGCCRSVAAAAQQVKAVIGAAQWNRQPRGHSSTAAPNPLL